MRPQRLASCVLCHPDNSPQTVSEQGTEAHEAGIGHVWIFPAAKTKYGCFSFDFYWLVGGDLG